MENLSQHFIESWKKKTKEELSAIKTFFSELESDQNRLSAQKLQQAHDNVFSKMDCLQCGNCCKTTPPIYTRKDVKRIAQFLNITPKQFIRKYTIEDVNGELTGISVPCQFLNGDNTCSIYEVRPTACREYPHTSDPEYASRPTMNYNNTVVCPAAYAIALRIRSSLGSN